MKYVVAYLLASMGGKREPAIGDLEKILSSVGLDASKESIEMVINALKGKDIAEVIAEGHKKLASAPSATASAPQVAGVQNAPVEKKDESKKPPAEEEDEDDFDMLGLFD